MTHVPRMDRILCAIVLTQPCNLTYAFCAYHVYNYVRQFSFFLLYYIFINLSDIMIFTQRDEDLYPPRHKTVIKLR